MSARPRLFKATLFRSGAELLAVAQGKAWAREPGGWRALEPLPPRTQAAYVDPARGVMLLGWEGEAFVRRTWGGEVIDQVRLPISLQTIDSVAFDPASRTLVICGGDGSLDPWTLSLDDAGRVQLHEVALRHVVWDVGRNRVVGLQDCEVRDGGVSVVLPRVGPVVGGTFEPGAPLGGRAYSAPAWDEGRAAVIFFAQAECGVPATLHVVHGAQCVVEPLEAPPLNQFRLVHDGTALLAFGGQNFEGDRDSLWRLVGSEWREEA